MTFVNHCKLIQNTDFESKFVLEENKLENNSETRSFLQKELQKTRFEFSSVQISYQTVAQLEGLSFENIRRFWPVIETRLKNFPLGDVDYGELQEALSKICNDEDAIRIGVAALGLLINRTRKILLANFEGLKNSPQKQMGFLGETISYLYVRDIKTADCIFSKIIPDNPHMPRHGMDLVSINFGKEDSKDVVYFWEVKSTIENFDDRCKEIVDWFNRDSESHLTMVIEAAKLDWKDKLSKENFTRASSVLAKFLFAKTNYEYSGSIIFDSANVPNDRQIRKFDEVVVPKENKRLVLFKIEDFESIMDGVYGELCKI